MELNADCVHGAGEVRLSFERERWRRAKAIFAHALTHGNESAADLFDVHPAYVSKVLRALRTWEGYPEEDLMPFSIERLYAAALLAAKVGKAKAFDALRRNDASSLYAMARDERFPRKRLPNVDEGVHEMVMSLYRDMDDSYYRATGNRMSFDRFLETLVYMIRESLGDMLRGERGQQLMAAMWGSVYD